MPATSPKNDSAPQNASGGGNGDKRSGWAQVAKYSEIAFIFPAATVAGLLVGVALDHWLHTSWLSVVGLLIGILAGFVQLIRMGLSSNSD